MVHLVERIARAIDRPCEAGAWLAAASCLALAFLLIAEIAATSLAGWSQPWAVEYSAYLCAIALFGGSGFALRQQFNVWEHLAPYAEDLISREIKQGYGYWLEEARILIRSLLSIPVKLDTILAKLDRGEIAFQSPDILVRVNPLEHSLKLVFRGILFTAFLAGGLQLHLGGEDTYAIPLLALAGFVLGGILLSFRRNRRAS